MTENSTPCGDCVHLSRTVRTRDWETRPLGYCYAYMTFRPRREVVPACQHAVECEGAASHPQPTPGER
jgi:hypothetical protein